MNVVVGSDHAGFRLKQALTAYLREKGIHCIDVGTDQAARCDYPDFAVLACDKIIDGEADWGLLICGTGIGMAMTANKVTGIRAAVLSDTFSARGTRAHNNANVLCLGERVVGLGLAQQIVDVWLATPFEAGRHQQRIDKISATEQRNQHKNHE